MLAFVPTAIYTWPRATAAAAVIRAIAAKARRPCWARFYAWTLMARIPYGIPPDNPFARSHTGRESLPWAFVTRGDFHLIERPVNCGPRTSDKTTGKKSTWSPRERIMAGASWKGPLFSPGPRLLPSRTHPAGGGIPKSVIPLCRHRRLRVSRASDSQPERHVRVRRLLQRPDHGLD